MMDGRWWMANSGWWVMWWVMVWEREIFAFCLQTIAVTTNCLLGGKGKDWNPLIHFNDRPIHSLHLLSPPITSLIFFLVNFTIMKNQQPIIFWALVYSCSVLSNCAKWGQFTEWPFMHSNGRNLKWPFKIGLATKQALSFSNL